MEDGKIIILITFTTHHSYVHGTELWNEIKGINFAEREKLSAAWIM